MCDSLWRSVSTGVRSCRAVSHSRIMPGHFSRAFNSSSELRLFQEELSLDQA